MTEGVHPILVPEQMQEMVIETALENLDFERVIRVSMYTKVFYFRQWNRLVVLWLASRRWLIALWVRSESADIHLPSRNGPIRVDLHMGEITNRSSKIDQLARTTTATKGSWYCWFVIWVDTSIPESQHPYPGCEWYQPIAFSSRPTLT